MLPLEYHASDTVLSLVITHHKRRCAELIDLEKAVNLADAGAKHESRRPPGTPFLFGEHISSSRETSDVHLSPMWRANGVRVLCYSYLLVSAGGAPGEEWRTMRGAMRNLVTVEQYVRLGRKTGALHHSSLVGAESSIRHEWHRMLQQDPSLSLNDAVELASKNAARPLKQELGIQTVSFFLTSLPYL